ncbi:MULTISPECIES: hypothetical protein [Romboutsia]|uniref:Uncharacterized protein n=1 Tax=Romboutsia hominis TaxID=1507512 RepID=A0A2P2BP80_9FIRM|nr:MULTISPECIES: hypothetical protein [Romboutsia]MCH1959202.1 hypothetical protein [Romboutsia hominis]MCH1970101.1 hypothetical protein [Romboutsia hominis]MDB8790317.1 hypothetical protein [Romboutsia sp. 1001216sp1]MDB8792250.1 hypothetical protein [Romboutsia sp. 1001216sp1]MDB8795544.1 hypothetical protein [Romboutsia sp. 1001216sp1]
MLKKHNCLQVIENTYLKETKIIKASTQKELQEKINRQVELWNDKEIYLKQQMK